MRRDASGFNVNGDYPPIFLAYNRNLHPTAVEHTVPDGLLISLAYDRILRAYVIIFLYYKTIKAALKSLYIVYPLMFHLSIHTWFKN